MIDRERKLIFVHVPKCGGTSVESAMAEAAGKGAFWWEWKSEDQAKFFVGGNRQHAFLREQLAAVGGGKDYTVICLVRDPVARAASEMRYQLEKQNRLSSLKSYASGDLSAAITSGDLFNNAWPYHAARAGKFIECSSPVNVKIFRLEDQLPDLEATLSDVYGRVIKLPHLMRSKCKSNDADHRTDLTPGARSVLHDAWGADCALGDYPAIQPGAIPRVVWMLWEQGWANAPRVAKAAANSWKKLNPSWKVILLDKNSPEVLEAAHLWEGKNMLVQHRADLLRMHLMLTKGGCWADATVVCMQPLSAWVDEAVGDLGFFIFKNHPVANWFLAARPGSDTASRWMEKAGTYWAGKKKSHIYCWPHRLMGEMINDGEVTGLVHMDASDKFQKGPHMLCPYHADANGSPGPQFFARLISERPKMLKMTWKMRIAAGSKFDIILKSFE